MARTVEEIMNRELLSVRPDLPTREALELLRSFGVGAAPVVDDARRPLGVLSLRDALDTEATAQQRMTKPAICVPTSTTVEDAARRLGRTDMHHLIVVDGAGTAVGMLSTLDLMRALVGLPARHPQTFPHWDEATKVAWTDEAVLDEEGALAAPEAPGVLVLSTARLGDSDASLWVESCADIRKRVRELVEGHPTEPVLARVLALCNLRYRAAVVADESARERVVAILRDRLDHVPPLGAT